MGDEPDADAPAGRLGGLRRGAETRVKQTCLAVINRSYLPSMPVVAASFLASFLAPDHITVDAGALPVIITTSSVIVGLAAGFAVRMTQSMIQFRTEKLLRLAGNQDKLHYYGRAFGMLASRIEQAASSAPQGATAGLEDQPLDASDQSAQLAELLKEFSSLSSRAPHDFGAIDKIVNKGILDDLVLCMGKIDESVSNEASLDRFRMAVKASNDLGRSVEASVSDKEMEYVAYMLGKGFENDWRRPSFWVERIRDCNKALARMDKAGRYVYKLEDNSLKRSGAIIFFMSLFGVILPITTMVAAFLPSLLSSSLSIAGVAGFVSYFAVYLGWIYMRMSSQRIWRF